MGSRGGLCVREGVLVGEDPITVAVVGCGRDSRTRIQPNITRLPYYRYVAACDRRAGMGEDCARRLGADSWFTDYREMLAVCKPEAVIIVGSPEMHYAIGQDCIRRGIHVFVEKRPAPSAAKAEELARLAGTIGVNGMVGTMGRHSRAYRMARTLLEDAEGPRVCFAGLG